MIIMEILARNARMYGSETALIEREPSRNIRRTLTWEAFDRQSNQLARALMELGVSKGDRVIHLMTNCIEWLPIYFGILRTGAWAVPLNFRFESPTILRCADVSEAKIMIFGPEFIQRIDRIKNQLDRFVRTYIYVGPQEQRPDYAVAFTDLRARVAEPGELLRRS